MAHWGLRELGARGFLGPRGSASAARSLAEQVGLLGQPGQFRHRAESQLLHSPAAMEFHGLFHDLELGRDLLVELPGRHATEHLDLAGAQGSKPFRKLTLPGLLGEHLSAEVYGSLDRESKLATTHRFGQKIECPRLHGLHGEGDTALATHEDDGKMTERVGQHLLDVEAAQSGEEDVQDQAARAIIGRLGEELLGRPQGHGAVAMSSEECDHDLSDHGLVIDDVHDRLWVLHLTHPVQRRCPCVPATISGRATSLPKTIAREDSRSWAAAQHSLLPTSLQRSVDKCLPLTYNPPLLSGAVHLTSHPRKVLVSRKEVILTEEGLKQLQDEVAHLSTVKREEVAERIRAAREFGDITENSEYDDAKNDQALLEHRISLLQEKLRRARVVKDSEIDTEKVCIGSTVTLRDKNAGEIRIYTLVGSAEADPTKARLSNESPVGQAIIGKRVGDVVTVPVPVGALTYEVLAIGKTC